MPDQEFTSKFKVDISDLQGNIRQAQQDIKTANAVFKAETAGMESWAKNADGLAAKLGQLDKVLSSQKTILASYEVSLEKTEQQHRQAGERADEYRKKLEELRSQGVSKTSEEYKKYESLLKSAVKEQQNTGKAAEALNLKVLRQKAAVGETEGQIEKYSRAQAKLESDSKSLTRTIDAQQKDLRDLKSRYADVVASEGKNSDSAKALAKEIRSLSSELNENQREMDQSRAEADKLDQTFDRTQKSSHNLAGKLASGLKTGLMAIGTAAVSAAGGLIAASKSTASYADNILTLSTQTGISTDNLEAYNYAAELVDVSMETLTGSMARNVRSMTSVQKGSKEMTAAYEALGVSALDSNGNLRDSEEVYWELIDALGQVEDDTQRDALAMQIFGRSAQDLNPLIEKGSKGIKELTDEAREMGAVMGEDALKAAGEFDDSMQRLKGAASGAKNALGMILMPALKNLSDKGSKLLGNFTKKLNASNGDWKKISSAIGETVGEAATVLAQELPKALDIGINAASSVIKALTDKKVIKTITSAITSAVPQLVRAAGDLFSGLVSALPDVIGEVVKALPDIVSALWDSVTKSIGSLGEAIGRLLFNWEDPAKKAAEALQDSLTAANDYVTGLEELKPQLADYNKLLSDQGRTVSDLDGMIKEAEDQVTAILKQALSDQQGLRDEDVANIRKYMDDINALEQEKLGIYRSQQISELKKLQLEGNNITMETGYQYLSNVTSALDEANKATDKAYTNELTRIEQYHQAQGTIGSEAYQIDLENVKKHHDANMAENQKYYQDSLHLLQTSAAEWVATDLDKWEEVVANLDKTKEIEQKFGLHSDHMAAQWKPYKDKYVKTLSEMDHTTTIAYLNMIATAKKSGAKLDDSTVNTAKTMLAAFDDLPEEFEEVGRSTLLELARGLSDEIPALANASSMTTAEILREMRKGLGVTNQIGTEAAKGVAAGIRSGEYDVRTAANGVMSAAKGAFSGGGREFEGIGSNFMSGLSAGIRKGQSGVLNQMTETLNSVVKRTKAVMQIKSPSRVFAQIGDYMAQGLGVGFVDEMRIVKNKISGAVAALTPAVGSIAPSIGVPAFAGASAGGSSVTYNQVINAPKAPSRLELYRQTRNLLELTQGGV